MHRGMLAIDQIIQTPSLAGVQAVRPSVRPPRLADERVLTIPYIEPAAETLACVDRSVGPSVRPSVRPTDRPTDRPTNQPGHPAAA